MHNKSKRILWLINHTTLREFEIPLLLSFGYEVFTPKRIPEIIHEWSGSVDYSHDQTLTIPKEALDILNKHNFYDTPMTAEVAAVVNEYFDTAFCIFYPTLLEHLSQQFKGRVLLRAFGLDKEKSYAAVIELSLGHSYLQQLQLMGDRFWFSEAYPDLHEIEPAPIRLRRAYHPIGLPDSFFNNQNRWVGGINKILFFCSRINAAKGYYDLIYNKFKKHFGDLPHLIAGNQPVPVNDPNVAGFQPRKTIEEWLCTFAVMFYHSDEPRHLHYHPLEAIAYGMPLIFMKQGILGKIDRHGTQPGACETFEEARKKILRVLRNDKKFIAEIRQHQTKLLEPFTLEFCRQEWEKNFVKKIMSAPHALTKQKPIKTIGVFLPIGYRGGSLNGAKNIAKMLHLGSRAAGEPVNVIFSCITNTYNLAEDFGDLLEMDIPVRETTWKIISKQDVSFSSQFTGANCTLNHEEYSMPKQGVSDFTECDFWLIISDRLLRPLAPIKPYGMVIYDYIQRYVPEIFPAGFNDHSFLTAARSARFVLTTTPTTREDAIQYAGLSPHRAHLAPMEFNPLNFKAGARKFNDDYLIWPTNASPHKNHLNALKALSIYYQELDGKLKTVITGPTTQFFRSSNYNLTVSPYITSVIELIEKNDHLKQNIRIMGNLTEQDYITALSYAKFLWHPTIIDNGTYAVIEAAYHQIPALSSNYPQMQFINERFKLNLSFCQASQSRQMAQKLKEMEDEHYKKRQLLPQKEFLEQFTYTKTAAEFWHLIRSLT